jgi:hypothetical protein
MVINQMLHQTFIERLVARDYYVSGASGFLPFVAPRPLTEPDKRLSHTSGSSVRPSVRLRPTTRVQVFADSGGMGHSTQANAWLKLAQVYALRWLLRLSHLNRMLLAR